MKKGRQNPSLYNTILDLMVQENTNGLERLFGKKVVFWKPEDSEVTPCDECGDKMTHSQKKFKVHGRTLCKICDFMRRREEKENRQ
jgi:hypothetical protein